MFHLFDQNKKKLVQSILLSVNGADSWPQFRHDLELCTEAGSEAELELLWSEMISEWFQEKEGRKNAIKYHNTYIYSNRSRWATTYFKRAFKMGYSTTQRAES